MENSIHNSMNFWKEIRRFTNKSKVSNNIHLEEWYHYFHSLFTTNNLIEQIMKQKNGLRTILF